MTPERRRVLLGILLASVFLATLVLADVVWTVFFAATVAYVLLPLQNYLREQGVPNNWAAVVSTGASVIGLSALLGITGYLLYRRRIPVLTFVRTLPDTVEIRLVDVVYVLDTAAALDQVGRWMAMLGFQVAAALPALSLKLTVFAFVVFALLIGHETVEEAVLAVVPTEYRDVASSFATRVNTTLFSLYVLQVATAVATFVVALPVFYLLGYDIFLTLAVVSGMLQFLPIVGPSILVVGLAIFHITVGNSVAALLVLVVGGVLVAWLPDVTVRPRLARETGQLPGTLYFVGFVGGLLTVGPVGIIAGPLAVALVAESFEQLESIR
ncbi:MAG: AI-2E family transporter [Halodesulfurarchaeum sp.]